ncbi:glycosyltransferase [Geitlerinema sp. PCC 9228]|uniref:glycosyltransferase n=1 Tax=Geitlerinema sp. PCC 9228 TaxID=111611 RepID=UPI0008F9B678|nr:glycosyltransferase [Geitlerinema sp. PCC 9228]
MNTCSIIVRCFNEEEHIGKLLSGIMQQTVKDIETIVVDSGSTDATLSIASRYPVKIVSIQPEEFSFGRALNRGCQAASGEFIIVASAHVYPVYKDWLEHLLLPFDDPQVALVYGKQRGNEITKYSEHQVFASWFPEESSWQQQHPFCNNANAAIRRSLWQQVPYNEELTGLEDLDWARRVQTLGYKVVYSATAEIVHVHHETPKKIYNRYRREAIALKRIFPQEQFHWWDFVRLFVGNTFSDWFHAWHDGVFWSNVGDIFVFRFMQFWGTYRGFLQHGTVSSELKRTFYYPKGFRRSDAQSPKVKSERAIDYASLPKEKELEQHH